MKPLEKIRHYYNVMGDLSHMNLILKVALTLISFCLISSLFVVVKLASRPPLIITILPDGKAIPTAYQIDNESTLTEPESHKFIREFLAVKYHWTPETVERQLKKASSFLTRTLRLSVREKITEDIAYIKNTGMTQHLYVKEIKGSDSTPFKKTKTFLVTGDRVIGIRGAKFTTDIKITLTLLKTKRSQKNLSGLKILKLKEIQSKKEQNDE